MKPTVMLSTYEYEFSHGRSPRGLGGWAFEFAALYFDREKLENAVRAFNAHSAQHQRKQPSCASIDYTTYPGHVLIWVQQSLYADARRAATMIAKLGARPSAHTLIGKVAS